MVSPMSRMVGPRGAVALKPAVQLPKLAEDPVGTVYFFTASGSWVSSFDGFVSVEGVGAGAKGDASDGQSSTTGGGGGGYAKRYALFVQKGKTYAFQVGSAAALQTYFISSSIFLANGGMAGNTANGTGGAGGGGIGDFVSPGGTGQGQQSSGQANGSTGGGAGGPTFLFDFGYGYQGGGGTAPPQVSFSYPPGYGGGGGGYYAGTGGGTFSTQGDPGLLKIVRVG